MLIKITNYCTMGCSHCQEDSTSTGSHMTLDMFKKALDFNYKYDVHNQFNYLIIGGGEPTDHPQFKSFLLEALSYSKQLSRYQIMILSNGLFLNDINKKYEEYLDLDILFQITNDSRYYPQPINMIQHPKIVYSTQLINITPLGRAADKTLLGSKRKSPLCFNLRSCATHFNDFTRLLFEMRKRNKWCTPAITVNGMITAGESSFCYPVGDINDNGNILVQNIREMNNKCNKCNLEGNLDNIYKKVINCNT